MRFQIITTLRRLGNRADYNVDTIHTEVPVRWIKKDAGIFGVPDYVFQIGDGVSKHSLMRLLSTEARKKIFLAISIDQAFLEKTAKDISTNGSIDSSSIQFVSVKDFRTTMETSLSKIIFGTAVYGSGSVPNLKQKGSMPNLEVKTGLTITKIGKDLGYSTKNPSENVFTWFMPGDKIKILEAVVGDGFKFADIKKLNNSDARKKVYIAVKLYGDPYKQSVDKIIRTFPNTMVEFMTVAELDTTKSLEDFLRKRLEGDFKVREKINNMKPKKDVFDGW